MYDKTAVGNRIKQSRKAIYILWVTYPLPTTRKNRRNKAENRRSEETKHRPHDTRRSL